MTDTLSMTEEETAYAIAESCRILGMTGIVRETTGHASTRIAGTDEMLIRSRRPADPGVSYSTPSDILRVDFDGNGIGVEGLATPGQMGSKCAPSEFPIHAEVYRARPDVGAVIHGHPKNSLLCGILGLPLNPIVGAYDPGALDIAVGGVPVVDTSVLIRTRELGELVAQTMGDSNACLLRGHGIVAVGDDIYEATMRAIRLETLCELTLLAYSTGRTPTLLSAEEQSEVLGFVSGVAGRQQYARAAWDHYRTMLAISGGGSPEYAGSIDRG